MEFKNLIPWSRGRHVGTASDNPFQLLHGQINRLFEDFFSGSALTPFSESNGWQTLQPRIDIAESKEEVRVNAEIPGVDANDIDISLGDDYLTIRGERKSETTKEQDERTYTERSYGSFTRTIPLPCEVDAEQVEATFDKGVLTVRMPKSREVLEQSRKIPIATVR